MYDNAQSSDLAGYWWLISPSHYNDNRNNAYIFYVAGGSLPGFLGRDDVDTVYGFRPVISLKSDTLILRGDGRHGSPYIITEPTV